MLYNFCSLVNCSDGASPLSGLIADKQGALYGTTFYGAATSASPNGYGAVFRIEGRASGFVPEE